MKTKKICIILFLLILIFTGCSTQNPNELSGDLSYIKTPDEIYVLTPSLIEDLESANNKILEINSKIHRYEPSKVPQELYEDLNRAVEITYAIKSKKVRIDDSKFINKMFSNLSDSKGKIVTSEIQNPKYILELMFDDIQITQKNLAKGYLSSILLLEDGTVIIPKLKENIAENRYIETKLDLQLLQELDRFISYTK